MRKLLQSIAAMAITMLIASPALATTETLTVAGGCFWCVEADFESVPGVEEVVSGYTGGKVEDPTYKEVTKGDTGHYEAVEIRFDPNQVTREQLLKMFFRSIDPTDAAGQFCDRGPSYRTAIFVNTTEEKVLAARAVEEAQAALGKSIVTPILQAGKFYVAEDFHQDYYKSNRVVITRFGPVKRSFAYKRYRKACGRDKRVLELWGAEAPFAKSS